MRLASLSGVEAYQLHIGPIAIVAIVVALLGVGLSWIFFGRAGAVAPTFSVISTIADSRAVNRVYEWTYRSAMLRFAALLGWIDRYIIDGLMNFLGWSALRGGAQLRRLQTGFTQDYVAAAAIGAVALAVWGLLQW